MKALSLAAKALKRPELLETAAFCAGFILDNRITSGEDAGLILAFEDLADKVNTSAVLESLSGLFYLSEATGDEKYARYLMHLRRKEALELLTNTEIPPEQLPGLCGFSSKTYFYQVVKKVSGETPETLRRSGLKKISPGSN